MGRWVGRRSKCRALMARCSSCSSGGVGATPGPSRIVGPGRGGAAGVERFVRLAFAALICAMAFEWGWLARLLSLPARSSSSARSVSRSICAISSSATTTSSILGTLRRGPAGAALSRLLGRRTAGVVCRLVRWSRYPAGARSSASGIDRCARDAGARATPRRAIARRSCRVLAHRGEWRAPLCRRHVSTSRPVRPRRSKRSLRARCRWPVRR